MIVTNPEDPISCDDSIKLTYLVRHAIHNTMLVQATVDGDLEMGYDAVKRTVDAVAKDVSEIAHLLHIHGITKRFDVQ